MDCRSIIGYLHVSSCPCIDATALGFSEQPYNRSCRFYSISYQALAFVAYDFQSVLGSTAPILSPVCRCSKWKTFGNNVSFTGNLTPHLTSLQFRHRLVPALEANSQVTSCQSAAI